MSDHEVLLRGGSRDGESTTVAHDVRRLLAASAAPGLLDVYEDTGEQEDLAGTPARVFGYVGREPTGDISPEALHGPSH